VCVSIGKIPYDGRGQGRNVERGAVFSYGEFEFLDGAWGWELDGNDVDNVSLERGLEEFARTNAFDEQGQERQEEKNEDDQ
jgi:hypothetical protein